MNGNRMKYTSTPTYGMQKHGLFKKTAPTHQAPEAPDFSRVPEASAMPPLQQPFAAPKPPFAAQMPSQAPLTPPMGFYPQPSAMQPPMPSAPAAPFGIMPQSGVPLPPMPSQQLPLGNTVPPLQGSASFSARSQGYVPPQSGIQGNAPFIQPATSVDAMPSAPFASAAHQPFAGVPVPEAPPAVMNFAVPNPYYAPVQPGAMPPSSAYPQQPAGASQQSRQPLDANMLWSVFLFGLLPLLFIPCLFVSSAWDALRYVFMGLTVVGLGVMWYRQMYGSATRLIVSMVYVALCVVTIAMLMQGARDTRQAAANLSSQPAVAQETPVPDQIMAAAAPVATPTPMPEILGPSEAERRLELFMSLWQSNNTTEMVSLVQPSWCSKQENPSQTLFTVLKNRTPEDFVIEEISGSDADNSRTVTMRATINKNTGKAPSVYRFMIMMVKEGGEWYVNPNSLATNDEVETTDENVVNNKNQAGTVTEPPRTTVTPPPPASTLLYYNDGANFYHMDPNCISVKSEYLPFDFQFAYGDLKTVRNENGLSPCLKCNAPTNTLD